jgi:DNA polymerase III epsilon subunit family exonuclease
MTEQLNPMPTALENVSFAVVDLETTGVDPSTDRILQMAAIVIDGTGKVVDTFDTIVKPESPEQYVHGAEHIHGISEAQVAKGMPLRDALARLRQISDGKFFTAHNAQFDIGFIHAESQRVGFDMTVNTFVDTLQLARRTDAERTRKHTLDALCAHYGIERDRAHEAKADATATAELLVHLMREMNITSGDQLDDLLS